MVATGKDGAGRANSSHTIATWQEPATGPNGQPPRRQPDLHRTLYVDALTYQPLRTVTVADGNPSPYVADWMPATPGNIAKAKEDEPIPVGYTKVDNVG